MRESSPLRRLGRGLSQLADSLRRRIAGRLLEEARAEARLAETRLRTAIDALPEGVVFLDEAGRYVLWNRAYAEVFGRSGDVLTPGVSLIDVVKQGIDRGDIPEALGREEAWLAERMARMVGPGARYELQLSNDRWLMVDDRRTADGGVIGLRIDITDMKLQAAALEAALSRAEAANRAKSEFLANMSHEIRTPLNGVLGLTEVLAGTSLDPTQRDLVRMVLKSATALNAILADILDLSRLEAGKVEMASHEFYLDDLVRDSALALRPAAQEKGLALAVEIADGAGREVVGDASRIRQVLNNLIHNAIKFTEAGRIDVRVEPSGAGGYRFAVTDTGVGFDPQFAERLFERFEQADTSLARKHGGVGLGLAICQRLVQLMGGTISAEGVVGRGATFAFTLPLPDAEAIQPSSPPQPAPARTAEPPTPEAGLRVLVADDSPTNRKVAELILAAIGAHVVCVEDGVEAVATFEAQSFDVVLMDLQMPRMDGLTAIRAIRQCELQLKAPRTPIAVLSANVNHEHQVASRAAGADAHLGKPFRAEDLIALVAGFAHSEAEPRAKAG